MKIETKGKQLFSVPNNEEGKLFLHLMRKFANYTDSDGNHYRLNVKGRGKNRKGRMIAAGRPTANAFATLPADLSDWMAVYRIKVR